MGFDTTPSQETDVPSENNAGAPPLVQLLRRGAREKLDPNELRAARQAYLASLDETQASVNRFLSDLPADVANRCASARTRAIKAFSMLRTAATKSLNADALETAISRTNASLAALRERGLVELGPTAVSGINLICRLISKLIEGQPSTTTIAQAVRLELQGIRDGQARPQENDVAEAMQQLAAALEALLPDADHLPADVLASHRDALVAAATQLEQTVTSRGVSRIEALLTNVQIFGDAGRIPRAIPLVREDLGQLRDAIQNALAQDAGEELRREVEPAIALLERCDALLEQMEAGQGVAEEVVEALTQLMEFQRALTARAEREGTIPCIRCGHNNGAERKVCANCGAMLMISVGSEGNAIFSSVDSGPAAASNDELHLTDDLRRILAAIERYGDGRMSDDEWRAEITWMDGYLASARARVLKNDEANALHAQGVEQMVNGAAALGHALSTRSPSLLEKGRDLILDGATTVMKAERM